MYILMLQMLLLVTPGAKNMPVKNGKRLKILKVDNLTIKPYSPDVKPSFYYFLKSAGEFNENSLRSLLHTNGIKRKVSAEIKPVKDRNQVFKRETVSYAEILANLKTMEEWKETQNKLKRGEVKNVQMAKLNMEDRIRKMRLEFVKTHGTRKEYRAELEAYKKFEAFKNRFLKGKEVGK